MVDHFGEVGEGEGEGSWVYHFVHNVGQIRVLEFVREIIED